MEHAEAFETNAPDRYLLGQLSAAEADAFEEHYFDCTTCAEEVRLGMSFLEAGRRLVREPREPAAPPAPAAPVVPIDSHPRHRGFRWIPAAAVAAMLAIPVNIGLLMRMQTAVPVPTLSVIYTDPAEAPHFVGPTRTDRKAPTLKLPEGTTGVVSVEVPPPRTPSSRYEARVLRGGKAVVRYPFTHTMIEDTMFIPIPDPGPGTYDLTIVGIEPAGENEIVRHTFVVKR